MHVCVSVYVHVRVRVCTCVCTYVCIPNILLCHSGSKIESGTRCMYAWQFPVWKSVVFNGDNSLATIDNCLCTELLYNFSNYVCRTSEGWTRRCEPGMPSLVWTPWWRTWWLHSGLWESFRTLPSGTATGSSSWRPHRSVGRVTLWGLCWKLLFIVAHLSLVLGVLSLQQNHTDNITVCNHTVIPNCWCLYWLGLIEAYMRTI